MGLQCMSGFKINILRTVFLKGFFNLFVFLCILVIALLPLCMQHLKHQRLLRFLPQEIINLNQKYIQNDPIN